MSERIQEFTVQGRDFVYLDMSDLQSHGDLSRLIEAAKPTVRKYRFGSLHTVTNVKHVIIDTPIKETLTDWVAHNKPYVRSGAICGVDGIKKIMLNSILTLCGRQNIVYVTNLEQGVEWLLKYG